jgi:hypothetical protein
MERAAADDPVCFPTIREVAGIAAGIGADANLRHPRNRGWRHAAGCGGDCSDAQSNNWEDTACGGEWGHHLLHNLTYFLL